MNYDAMIVADLRQAVRKRGWKGTSVQNASKDELIHFLETDEKPGAVLAPLAPCTEVVNNELSLEFSEFSNINNSSAVPLQLDKEGFIKLLAKRFIRNQKDGKLFAPAKFDRKRSNQTFNSASGVCLDFDHGQPSLEAVMALFPNTLMAYYSTYSHTPDNPRFRVVIPLSSPVNDEEHFRLVVGIKSVIPPELMECLDTSCFEKARPHFLPSCPAEYEPYAFTGHQDGDPLDVDHYISLGVVSFSITGVVAKAATVTTSCYEFVDTTTGDCIDLSAWAAQNPKFDIVNAIDKQYRRASINDGKQHIQCPFEDQHTDQGHDLATFVANASPDHPSFTIHCMHAHCAERDRLEFIRAMLCMGYFSVEHLQSSPPAEVIIKRPPYMNYRGQEFVAELQKQSLSPEEFRVHLHLMHIAVVAYNGTLPDDDWTIARALGISEQSWLDYRSALVRSGWYVADDNRLFNAITKREYQASQAALMKKSAGGRIGGDRSAQIRREREAYLEG